MFINLVIDLSFHSTKLGSVALAAPGSSLLLEVGLCSSVAALVIHCRQGLGYRHGLTVAVLSVSVALQGLPPPAAEQWLAPDP